VTAEDVVVVEAVAVLADVGEAMRRRVSGYLLPSLAVW